MLPVSSAGVGQGLPYAYVEREVHLVHQVDGLVHVHAERRRVAYLAVEGDDQRQLEGGLLASGELVEDPPRVDELRLSYDVSRDRSLSPEQTTQFIEQLIKEMRACVPSDLL